MKLTAKVQPQKLHSSFVAIRDFIFWKHRSRLFARRSLQVIKTTRHYRYIVVMWLPRFEIPIEFTPWHLHRYSILYSWRQIV